MNSYSYNKIFEDKRSELARCVSRSDIYRTNSFRILNIPINASSNEIAKHVKKLDLLEKTGELNKQVAGILPLTPLPDSTVRSEANQRLSDPESRLIDEILWFWPVYPKVATDTDEALTAIKHGDIDKAISTWGRHAREEYESNTAKHNLAVLYHAMALDLEHLSKRQKLTDEQLAKKRVYWKNALSHWKDIFENEWLTQQILDRIIRINDPRLNKDECIKIKEGLPVVLLSINASLVIQAVQKQYSEEASFHLGLLLNSGFHKDIIDQAILFVVNPLREQVKAICSDINSKAIKTPKNNDKLAIHLEQQTPSILSALDTLLLKGNPVRETLHDQIAQTMVDLIHAFCKQTDDWKTTIKILKRARKIAESELLLKRISDDIVTCEGNMQFSTCWFCQKSPAIEKAAVSVKMYGDVQRIGDQVQYRKFDAKVPRCKQCSSLHSKRSAGAWITGFVCACSGGLVAWLALKNGWAVVIAIAALIAGYQIGSVLNPLPKGIKNANNYKEFPMIKNLLLQGWAFGEKPSGVS
jgi:hypothetical protein